MFNKEGAVVGFVNGAKVYASTGSSVGFINGGKVFAASGENLGFVNSEADKEVLGAARLLLFPLDCEDEPTTTSSD